MTSAALAPSPAAQTGRSDTVIRIGAFLTLVAAAEAALTVAMVRTDPRSGAGAAVMLGIMWAPGLTAMAVQLFFQRSLRGFGWRPGPFRYLALAYFLPMLYGGLVLVGAQALGAGTISFERWAAGAGRWGLPPYALNGMLIQMTVFLIPGLVMGLGEEIGWRGFLAPQLARLTGFWGVVNASYVIWLAFHLPGMFFGGYHGQGTPLWYSLACFAVLLYPSTVFMTWLRFRTGSLWPCAVHHAAHNLFLQVMWNSAFKPNAATPWFVGEFGALTPIAVGLLVWAWLRWEGGTAASLSRTARAGVSPR